MEFPGTAKELLQITIELLERQNKKLEQEKDFVEKQHTNERHLKEKQFEGFDGISDALKTHSSRLEQQVKRLQEQFKQQGQRGTYGLRAPSQAPTQPTPNTRGEHVNPVTTIRFFRFFSGPAQVWEDEPIGMRADEAFEQLCRGPNGLCKWYSSGSPRSCPMSN